MGSLFLKAKDSDEEIEREKREFISKKITTKSREPSYQAAGSPDRRTFETSIFGSSTLVYFLCCFLNLIESRSSIHYSHVPNCLFPLLVNPLSHRNSGSECVQFRILGLSCSLCVLCIATICGIGSSRMIFASGVIARSPLVHWIRVGEVTPVSSFAKPITINYNRRHIKLRNSTRGRIVTATMSDGAQSTDPNSKAVNVVIKGIVQGVFYRKWTMDAAQKLGVNGWVRNCRDGSVEAVFSGSPSVVDTMIQLCHSGPSAARVWSVNVSQWENEVPSGFEQKSTW